MGFFSWDCKSCGHPMLSAGATEDKNGWMSNCVALTKNGSRFIGEYDGYGRLDDVDISEIDDSPCMYHHDCWTLAGEPTYSGPSEGSADQGWFFDDNAHNVESPLKKKPLDPVQAVVAEVFFDKQKKSNTLFSYNISRPAVGSGTGESLLAGVFEDVEILQSLQCTDSFVIPPGTQYSKAVIRPYYNEATNGFLVEVIFHGVCLEFTHTVILKTDLFGESSWVQGWIDG